MRLTGLLVVNFRSGTETVAAIESFRSATDEPVGRVLVVDNGGADAGLLRARGLDVLVLDKNMGFAAGVNAGTNALLRDRTIESVLIVNPDIRFAKGAWSAWAALGDSIAAKGPRIVSPDGEIQSSHYDRSAIGRIPLEALGVQRIARALGLRRAIPEAPTLVDAVQGSCMLIGRRAWESVGSFDEEFFLYHEEVDWSLRAHDAGFRILYDPSVSIVHEKGTDIPEGRELLYFRGAIRLVEKRCGASRARVVRRQLKWAARIGALLTSSRLRASALREMAEEL